jgi:hypothetical protein
VPQVCNVPLSHLPARSYERRYKVCSDHRNSPSVALNGKEARWCQSHNQFEELLCFDGNKK